MISNLFNIGGVRAAVEIAIIFMMLYFILRFLRGTLGGGVLRGLVLLLVGVLLFLALAPKTLGLDNLVWLVRGFLQFTLIYIVILFQPEIRRALIRIGHNPLVGRLIRSEVSVTGEITKAAMTLSKNRMGGLIAIERDVGLGSFVEGGVRINGDVSSALLVTIFWPGTPLHDGAVIIRGSQLIAAGCLFPLAEKADLGKSLGTRHRAAVGVTEVSDAVCVVVSEETGNVSVTVGGNITRNLDAAGLHHVLDELLTETRGASKTGAETDRSNA